MVGATCIGVAAKGEVSELEFDWVIVDEAGRAIAPELLVPIVRGRKIVLVGDHRQLPPTITEDLEEAFRSRQADKRQMQVSLFQSLIQSANREVKNQLEVQYRMHPAIGDLISQCFYEGRLQSGVAAEDRLHNLSWLTNSVVWYDTSKMPNSKERGNRSVYNQAEIETIIKLLDKIDQSYFQAEVTDQLIGIITAYAAQKRDLRARLEPKRSIWSTIGSQLELDTVDAYQGRQRDIIIYSVVRSGLGNTIGFLSDERRLNVALSRARRLLIIVGNLGIELANSKTKSIL